MVRVDDDRRRHGVPQAQGRCGRLHPMEPAALEPPAAQPGTPDGVAEVDAAHPHEAPGHPRPTKMRTTNRARVALVVCGDWDDADRCGVAHSERALLADTDTSPAPAVVDPTDV